VPHADDLEFGAPLAAIHFLKLGYEVVQVQMTNSAYGTKRLEYKGKRIARIRKYELKKTIEVYKKYTQNELRIIWLGFIDGFLTLNNESVNRVVKLIQEERPDIIFAPDPVYPTDLHYDHINAGRIPYFALKRLKKEDLPKKVFFYYSFKNNYALQIKCSDLRIAAEAMAQHKSQVVQFKIKLFLFLYKRLQMIGNIIRHQKIALGYRELKFKNGKPHSQKPYKSIRDKFKYAFYHGIMNVYKEETYRPLPEELGLL
jgi:LmbE family N-acetylglucosaminyl deacetylase